MKLKISSGSRAVGYKLWSGLWAFQGKICTHDDIFLFLCWFLFYLVQLLLFLLFLLLVVVFLLMLFHILSPNHFSYILPSVRPNYYISPLTWIHMWYHFLRQDQSPMDCFNLTINEFFRGRNKSEIDVKSCFRCFLFLFLTKMQTQWKFLQKSWHAVLDIAPYLVAKHKECMRDEHINQSKLESSILFSQLDLH